MAENERPLNTWNCSGKATKQEACGNRDGCELYPEDCGRPQGSYAR